MSRAFEGILQGFKEFAEMTDNTKLLQMIEEYKENQLNESLEDNNYKSTTTGDIISDSFGNMSDEEIDDLMKLYRRLALKLGLRKSESDNITVIITPDEEYEIDEIKESAEKVDSISTKFSTIDIYEKDEIRFGIENIHYNSFIYFKNEKDMQKII